MEAPQTVAIVSEQTEVCLESFAIKITHVEMGKRLAWCESISSGDGFSKSESFHLDST